MSDPRLLAIAVMLIGACAGCASETRREESPSGAPTSVVAPRVPGAIERALFAPELVLGHAEAIALSGGQRTEIAELTIATQASLEALDDDLDVATAALAEALAASPIDEERAITAARAVTVVEGEIKLVHLRMLIRVRNALTVEQQARLAELRGP